MAAPAGQKRLMKERAELEASPVEGIQFSENEGDLYNWKVAINGPPGSPYEGGSFVLDLKLPPTYPFKPPTVQFATKLYHPNISNDSPPNSGMMCLGMLREDQWKPAIKLSAVLTFVLSLLREPDPNDAVETKIADQYKSDRVAYEKEAREWTKRYAMGKK